MTIIDMQFGYTALMCASSRGHQSICQLLLTRGADIDIKNNVSILDDHTEYIYRIHHHYHRLFMKNGDDAIYCARRNGHSEVLTSLEQWRKVRTTH